MKKIVTIVMLMGFCGDGMGAQYNGLELQLMGAHSHRDDVYGHRETHVNLENLSEPKNVVCLEQYKEQISISSYYRSSVKDVGVYALSGMMAGGLAFSTKIAAYLGAFIICSDIRNQGGTCSMDPCDPQVRLNMPNSSADTCELNYFANFSAYLAVTVFMAVTIYGIYKYSHASRQSKYKID